MKMKLGMQVGVGPGHIVLHGDPALPPPKGHSPQYLAHICCGQMAAWIKMSLGMELGLGPSDVVLHRDPSPPHQKGGRAPIPNFRLISIVAKQLDASRCHLVWYGCRPQPSRLELDGDPVPSPQKGGRAPKFSAHVYCGQTA